MDESDESILIMLTFEVVHLCHGAGPVLGHQLDHLYWAVQESKLLMSLLYFCFLPVLCSDGPYL